jgi:DNA polymerase-3 subunit chi
MLQATFYILNKKAEHDRYLFACKLAEKALHQGLRTLISLPSREAAEHMDSLLWTFRPDSFVPHDILPIAADHSPPTTPVGILYPGVPADGSPDIWINLTAEAPASDIPACRQIEIALNDPQKLARLRERYKTLTRNNITVEVHDFTKKTTRQSTDKDAR